ncbi:TPA: hypothetical protein QIM58_001714 [Morganella morganii subsp. morganii]|nr:hypothetical protein [Morganella morganii subsp. morganii]HEO9696037.1 hypothetical protein [Morganella morganii subsp. morganii]
MIELTLGDDKVTISEEQLKEHIAECQRVLSGYQSYNRQTNTGAAQVTYTESDY